MLSFNPFAHTYRWCDRDTNRRISKLLKTVSGLDIRYNESYDIPPDAHGSNLYVNVAIDTRLSWQIVVKMMYTDEDRSENRVVQVHLDSHVGFDVYPDRSGKSKEDAARDTRLIDIALSVAESHIDEFVKVSPVLAKIKNHEETVARENAARLKLDERLRNTKVLADYTNKNYIVVKAGTPRNHALFNNEIAHEDE